MMKLYSLLTFLCLSTTSIAFVVDRAADDTLAPVSHCLRRCNVSVCWAIDGSRGMTQRTFTAEKDFVTKVSSNLLFVPGPSKLGALQYASISRPIQRLTGNLVSFVEKIGGTYNMQGGLNINSAILGCRFLLLPAGRSTRHIILLIDGYANVGAEGFKNAEQFRRTGGLVSIVAAGIPHMTSLRRLAGSSGRVYRVKRFTDSLAMLTISKQLYNNVCTA